MFIRKKKVIQEIEAMRNELLLQIHTWTRSTSDDKLDRLNAFHFASGELEELEYWLKYGKRFRSR